MNNSTRKIKKIFGWLSVVLIIFLVACSKTSEKKSGISSDTRSSSLAKKESVLKTKAVAKKTAAPETKASSRGI